MNILHGQLTAVVRRRDAAQININLSKRSAGARDPAASASADAERRVSLFSLFW